MPDGATPAEIPHSEVVYAGFPLSGTNGLWCPVCGLPLVAVIHDADQTRGLHDLYRMSRSHRDKWYCVIQEVGYGT